MSHNNKYTIELNQGNYYYIRCNGLYVATVAKLYGLKAVEDIVQLLKDSTNQH
jgi:hypothetical protein